ncbi:iron-containing alcohol dehydrogenase [Cognatishimia sp. MH4019]|uniref:iron-containing alcohol dehydrogenase n=1 Tax=Cognatishimia sp. MH4019 TaxID=2854030 RepID=UPI001CD7AF9B|nr:iron-containing alcohol dehydrogenase [Cognatishimia sp. MH4019]
MKPYQLQTPRKIIFGRGASADASKHITAHGTQIALIHGASQKRAGWLIDALHTAGAHVHPLPCPSEPTLPMLEDALTALRPKNIDAVVGLGGGAPLDLAKALAALLPTKANPLDHLEVVGSGLPLTTNPLPFIALPTTSGTGAEATKNAVIGVPEHARKVSLRDDRMLATLALVDPALTDGCPKAITLASGLDAITQVIEPYISAKATHLTDALCKPAIPLGLDALKTLMTREDQNARDTLAHVALTSGIALANSGLGAVHGLAGVIGGLTPAPHGAVCGALLAPVLKTNAEALPDNPKIAEVQKLIATTLGDLPTFTQTHGLPTLEQMSVAPSDHAKIAQAAAASSSMKGNPTALSEAQLIACLTAA